MSYNPEVYSAIKRVCGLPVDMPMDDKRAMSQIKGLLKLDENSIDITDEEDEILCRFVQEQTQ